MDGLLPIYKPKGVISKDVSRILQKVIGKNHPIGHVGTLDPLAEGVLAIVLGKATRLQDYLLDSKKTYEFRVELGKHTDSLDADGAVLFEKPVAGFSKTQILEALKELTGAYCQVPPLYSAVKWQGKPLYEYARAGRGDEVPLSELSRRIEIYAAELIDFGDHYITCRIECSKGAYVRVFAYDLCSKLGNYGNVTFLKRTEAAGVSAEKCLNLNEVNSKEDVLSKLLPMEVLETGLSILHVSQAVEEKILQGQKQIVAFPPELNKIGYDKALTDKDILLAGPSQKLFGIGMVIEQHELDEMGINRFMIKLKRGL
ncbi:MAG: tRNA pseudouridine(55) synthase TruB [Pseudomonadota bacterium]